MPGGFGRSPVQQGAVGLAGSIDGAPEFIDRSAQDQHVRSNYRGPSLDNSTARIDVAILSRYQGRDSHKSSSSSGSHGHGLELKDPEPLAAPAAPPHVLPARLTCSSSYVIVLTYEKRRTQWTR